MTPVSKGKKKSHQSCEASLRGCLWRLSLSTLQRGLRVAVCREAGKVDLANAHLGITQALPCVGWKLTMVALVPFTAISHNTLQQATAGAQPEHSRLNPLDPASTALAPVFSRLENGTGSRVEVHGWQRGQSARRQQARTANLIRQKAAWQSFHPRLPDPPFLSPFLLIRSIFSPKTNSEF